MTDPTSHISRRTVVTGAAVAVPAVALLATTPAFAASGGPTVTTSAPNGQATAGDATAITALVKDAAGQPVAGQSVSFSGPNGTSFSPTAATTGSDGRATSNMTITDPWAKPGSTVTASATALGVTGTSGITVLGANAYAVGRNYYNDPRQTAKLYGKLGTGSTDEHPTIPAQLLRVFPSPIVTIADSRDHALALLEDGTVWALGRNNNGQLGDGTFVTRSTWAPVHNLVNVTQIAASSASSYALLSDGTVMAWGSNYQGRLGTSTGANDYSSLPVAVNNPGPAAQIAAGAFSGYAVLRNGTVRAWGDNTKGQLGNTKPQDDQTSPVTVASVQNAVQVTGAARSAYALLQNGTVKAWGETIGTSSSSTNTTAVTVDGVAGATALAAGDRCVYALLNDHTILAWGDNEKGQLGSGTWDSSTNPVSVSDISDAKIISSSYGSGFVIRESGSIADWGWNEDGQLGDGTTADKNAPIPMNGGMTNVVRFGTPSPMPASGWFIRST